ncbi:asparagine synthase-related protein [Pendulispora brunnea]|uniref:asparagine synthase (glutamine-hydrolyzing) n=1 Tax=Pendulispora brunnea TaxID=2905690 RepID=A0ABZ2JUJ3_9BACT
MKFVCAYRPSGGPVTEADFAPFARALGHAEHNMSAIYAGPFAAAGACIAENGARIAVGNAHMGYGRRLPAILNELDDRPVERWLGDFGIVVFDRASRQIQAMRDPFGVQSLFTADAQDLVLFSSHLALLEGHVSAAYSGEYVIDFLVEGGTRTAGTILRDVRTIPAGSLLVQRGPSRRMRPFWSALDFAARDEDASSETKDISRFRELFREAVHFNLGGAGETWSQLSGGLDSSSIVCTSTELAREGTPGAELAGTVTIYDDLCDADERVFVDAVTAHTGVENVKLIGYHAWRGGEAPRSDVPSVPNAHHAMRARMESAVTSAGGRVLLSGTGSDHYLDGRPFFIADALVRRGISAGARVAFEFAVEEKGSMWTVLGRCGALPLFPASIQSRFERTGEGFPRFLREDFLRATSARDRFRDARAALGGAGRKFDYATFRQLAGLPGPIEAERSEQVEMRYPFLYRPLVEHALRTPARFRVRPSSRKWILREAMRGTLPELVRTRRDKGGNTARTLWAMSNERTRWDTWLRDPFVAQLGWIEPAVLRAEIDELVAGRSKELMPVLHALSLEEWLRAREN